MQVLRTVYRAAVMLATLAIVVVGWRQYGPSEEQLKTLAGRVMEVADEVLGRDGPATNASDPRMAALAASAAPESGAGAGHLATAPSAAQLLPAGKAGEPPELMPARNADLFWGTDDISRLPPVGEPSEEPQGGKAVPGDDPQLRAVLARLEALGVREVQLEPWGSRGELYRFSCRVPWGETSRFARHVESVAEEPLAAVEAVAAKVDAWRLAE